MASTRAPGLQGSRTTCVVTMTLIFLAGAIAGALAMNLGAWVATLVFLRTSWRALAAHLYGTRPAA